VAHREALASVWRRRSSRAAAFLPTTVFQLSCDRSWGTCNTSLMRGGEGASPFGREGCGGMAHREAVMEATAGSVPASMAEPQLTGLDTRQGRRRREFMCVFGQEELAVGEKSPPGGSQPFKRWCSGVRRRGRSGYGGTAWRSGRGSWYGMLSSWGGDTGPSVA
jgi:hypothetical protein